MPYTRDQLMQGLRAADEAGDEAAAQAFARQIQALGAGAAPNAPTSGGAGSPPNASPSETLQPRSLSQVGQDAMNALRLLNRGLTVGAYDPIVGGIKHMLGTGSIGEERAKTETAARQLGPVPETLGAVASPANRLFTTENAVANIGNPILRWLARAGGYAAEGGAYSGVKAAGEGKDVPSAIRSGATTSALISPLGGMLTPTSPAGTTTATQDFKNAADAAQNPLLATRYSPADIMRTVRGVNIASTQRQINSDLSGQVAKLHNSFTDWSQAPGQEYSVKQLLDYHDAAKSIGANELADRIDSHLNNATPVRGPLASSDQVQDAIENYTKASKNYSISKAMDGQQSTIAGVPMDRPATYSEVKGLTDKGTMVGNIGQNVGDHAWRIAHSFTEPLALAAGVEGGIGPASLAAGTTVLGAPALKGMMDKLSASQTPLIAQRWRNAQAGVAPPTIAADPTWQRALQSMMLGSQ